MTGEKFEFTRKRCRRFIAALWVVAIKGLRFLAPNPGPAQREKIRVSSGFFPLVLYLALSLTILPLPTLAQENPEPPDSQQDPATLLIVPINEGNTLRATVDSNQVEATVVKNPIRQIRFIDHRHREITGGMDEGSVFHVEVEFEKNPSTDPEVTLSWGKAHHVSLPLHRHVARNEHPVYLTDRILIGTKGGPGIGASLPVAPNTVLRARIGNQLASMMILEAQIRVRVLAKPERGPDAPQVVTEIANDDFIHIEVLIPRKLPQSDADDIVVTLRSKMGEDEETMELANAGNVYGPRIFTHPNPIRLYFGYADNYLVIFPFWDLKPLSTEGNVDEVVISHGGAQTRLTIFDNRVVQALRAYKGGFEVLKKQFLEWVIHPDISQSDQLVLYKKLGIVLNALNIINHQNSDDLYWDDKKLAIAEEYGKLLFKNPNNWKPNKDEHRHDRRFGIIVPFKEEYEAIKIGFANAKEGMRRKLHSLTWATLKESIFVITELTGANAVHIVISGIDPYSGRHVNITERILTGVDFVFSLILDVAPVVDHFRGQRVRTVPQKIGENIPPDKPTVPHPSIGGAKPKGTPSPKPSKTPQSSHPCVYYPEGPGKTQILNPQEMPPGTQILDPQEMPPGTQILGPHGTQILKPDELPGNAKIVCRDKRPAGSHRPDADSYVTESGLKKKPKGQSDVETTSPKPMPESGKEHFDGSTEPVTPGKPPGGGGNIPRAPPLGDTPDSPLAIGDIHNFTDKFSHLSGHQRRKALRQLSGKYVKLPPNQKGKTRTVQLGKFLDEGAYGAVYKLIDEPDHVIKIIHNRDQIGFEIGMDSLRRQVRGYRYLKLHPEIPTAKITDHSRLSGDEGFLIMENIYEGRLQKMGAYERKHVALLTPTEKKALKHLYDFLGEKGLVWLDGHLGNVFFAMDKGKLKAGILDHDLLFPARKIHKQSKFARLQIRSNWRSWGGSDHLIVNFSKKKVYDGTPARSIMDTAYETLYGRPASGQQGAQAPSPSPRPKPGQPGAETQSPQPWVKKEGQSGVETQSPKPLPESERQATGQNPPDQDSSKGTQVPDDQRSGTGTATRPGHAGTHPPAGTGPRPPPGDGSTQNPYYIDDIQSYSHFLFDPKRSDFTRFSGKYFKAQTASGKTVPIQLGDPIGVGISGVVFEIKTWPRSVLKIVFLEGPEGVSFFRGQVNGYQRIKNFREIPKTIIRWSVEHEGGGYLIMENIKKGRWANRDVEFITSRNQPLSTDQRTAARRLYDQLAARGLIWLDGHKMNMFFFRKKGDALQAGILDHDLIFHIDTDIATLPPHTQERFLSNSRNTLAYRRYFLNENHTAKEIMDSIFKHKVK